MQDPDMQEEYAATAAFKNIVGLSTVKRSGTMVSKSYLSIRSLSVILVGIIDFVFQGLKITVNV